MQSTALQPMIVEILVDQFVFGDREDLKQGRTNNLKKRS